MLDAQDALAVLPPGATLLQAARVLADAAAVPAVPLSVARESFLNNRSHAAVDLTLRGYRMALKALGKICGMETAVASVSQQHVAWH